MSSKLNQEMLNMNSDFKNPQAGYSIEQIYIKVLVVNINIDVEK